jgi:hypothetical protein
MEKQEYLDIGIGSNFVWFGHPTAGEPVPELGDKLSLFPYSRQEASDLKYCIDLEPIHNTYLDLFALFIVHVKKTVYEGVTTLGKDEITIYDAFFADGQLSFDGVVHRKLMENGHYLWLLRFSS